MQQETVSFERSRAGGQAAITVYLPDGEIKGVIQVLHGMCEHFGRYENLARAVTEKGYVLAGHNHRGHGPEYPDEALGFFAAQDGWDLLEEDAHIVTETLKKHFPGKNQILLGHSMGSFAAREYSIRYGADIDALVLSGTGWHPRALCVTARMMAALAKPDQPSAFVESLAFSGNNKPFEPARTPFDWLSRNQESVDSYIADPYCGFSFKGRAFYDMFDGLLKLSHTERLKSVPKDLPVLFISGKEDPVGQQGKGVITVSEQYKEAGVNNVMVKLFEGGRHEMFNETNRDEAYAALTDWLDRCVTKLEEV